VVMNLARLSSDVGGMSDVVCGHRAVKILSPNSWADCRVSEKLVGNREIY
jgi:hypothetical protein